MGFIGDKEIFGLLCDDCHNSPTRLAEEQKEKINQQLANIRKHRIEKSDRLRNAISFVVPPLYRGAHIYKLPEIIRNKFFALNPSEGLFLGGSVGVGKSFSLYAFVRYYICKGNDVFFYRYEDFLTDLRATFSRDSEIDERELLNRLKTVRRLFIDDVGTTTGLNAESDFSLRTLFNVLDYRINYCLPTFLSTNKTVEELAKSFDKRIYSRIAGSCVVLNLSGKDKRLSNQTGRTK